MLSSLNWLGRKLLIPLHMLLWLLSLIGVLVFFIPAGMTSKSGWRDFPGWLLGCMYYNEMRCWRYWEGDDHVR